MNEKDDERDYIKARFGVEPTFLEWRSHFTYHGMDYIMDGVNDSLRGGTFVYGLWSVKRQCLIPMDTEKVYSDSGRAQVAAHKQIDKWREARGGT